MGTLDVLLQRVVNGLALGMMYEERRHQLAGTMSGGEPQMLAIARALMTSPTSRARPSS